MTNLVKYAGNQAGLNVGAFGVGSQVNLIRAPSPQIWQHCALGQSVAFPDQVNDGIHIFEDFTQWSGTVTSNIGTYSNGLRTFEDTSCTFLNLNTEVLGVAQMLPTSSGNKVLTAEVNGGNTATAGLGGLFSYTNLTGPQAWFEGRFRFNQVSAPGTLLGHDFFFGLMVKGATAATGTVFSNADAAADLSMIGFQMLAGTIGTINAVVNKAGAGGQNTVGAVQTSLAAATWIKLGCQLNPFDTINPVRWYVNGVQQQQLTVTSAATFPSAVVMVPVICFRSGSGVTGQPTCDIDWYKFAQKAPLAVT